MDLNRITMIGRLAHNPDIRYTAQGMPVARFSIANNRQYKRNGEVIGLTSFFQCVAWGQVSKLIENCKKGELIGIEGRLQQRPWEDLDGNKKTTIEIVVEDVQSLLALQEKETPKEFNQAFSEITKPQDLSKENMLFK